MDSYAELLELINTETPVVLNRRKQSQLSWIDLSRKRVWFEAHFYG
jgi:hypothetical protein